MREEALRRQLEAAQAEIETLQQELAETNHEVMALTVDLEKRVDERTAELREEIEERKRVEQALRQSEERFRVVMKASPIVMAITDRDLRYVWIENPHRDFDAESVIGKRDDELADNEATRRFMDVKRRVLEEEKGIRTEITFPLSEGTVTYDVTAEPLHDPEGNVIGVTTASLDITRRRQAEIALKQYSEHLEDMVEKRTQELEAAHQRIKEALTLNRAIITASPLGITAYDASCTCILANEAISEILEKPREEILDNDFRNITEWETSGMRQAAEEVLATGEFLRLNMRRTLASGKEVWLEHRFHPFEIEGKRHLLVVTDDVTARRMMHERMIRQEKLATLGQLSGSVSHELRNPLGAIKNAAYFLTLAVDSPDPDVQESLEILEREVNRSEVIISTLLNFARAEPPAFQPVNLNQLLKERTLQNEIPKSVHVVHHLDDEIPDVPADPNQLRRVFGNLIDNAVEAMPDGGQLTVVTAPKGDDAVAISITDTGEGISRANQAKIFEPLFTTKTEGIGLGLAMADSLIRGHGGTITVKSEEGEGSTFTVVLPIEQGG